MPYEKFCLIGSTLAAVIIAGASYYAVSAPPNPLMVSGGDPNLEKWAAPKHLRTAVVRSDASDTARLSLTWK